MADPKKKYKDHRTVLNDSEVVSLVPSVEQMERQTHAVSEIYSIIANALDDVRAVEWPKCWTVIRDSKGEINPFCESYAYLRICDVNSALWEAMESIQLAAKALAIPRIYAHRRAKEQKKEAQKGTTETAEVTRNTSPKPTRRIPAGSIRMLTE